MLSLTLHLPIMRDHAHSARTFKVRVHNSSLYMGGLSDFLIISLSRKPHLLPLSGHILRPFSSITKNTGEGYKLGQTVHTDGRAAERHVKHPHSTFISPVTASPPLDRYSYVKVHKVFHKTCTVKQCDTINKQVSKQANKQTYIVIKLFFIYFFPVHMVAGS